MTALAIDTGLHVSDDGLAHTASSGERFYVPPSRPGEQYDSITTIISAGNPNKFISVVKREITNAGMDTAAWQAMPEEDQARWIKGAYDRFMTDRGLLGTQVHQYLEDRLLGNPSGVPLDAHPEYRLRTAAVDRFIEEWDPAVVAVECAVFNHTHRYAGRIDALLELTGYGLCIVDAKTSADFWPSIDQQLAAGANAEVLVVDGVEVPMPTVDAAFGLLLHEDGVYHMGQVIL